jgi:1-acyl-sn-glycerol-3-phosphate acyltransferase
MVLLRFTVRAGAIFLHCLFGISIELVVFPLVGSRKSMAIARWWCRGVLWLVGVRVRHSGTAIEPGELVIANHTSWLDSFGVNSLHPVHFVAKSEVKSWPILGLIAKRSGTIFIERGRRHAVHEVIKHMAMKLREGETCAFFPEGTTTEGDVLLPFHANLLQAAVEAQRAVRPVILRYQQHGEPTRITAFIGDMTLAASLWQVLGSTGIELELDVLDAISPTQFETRHAISAHAHEVMSRSLGITTSSSVLPSTPAQPMQDCA